MYPKNAAVLLGVLATLFSSGCNIDVAAPVEEESRPLLVQDDGAANLPEGETGKAPPKLSITYGSPYISTESIEINGMFLPTGPWITGLCKSEDDPLSCTIKVPAGASSVLLSAHVRGDGAETWSCTESPCGSKAFSEVGALTVKLGTKKLKAELLANGLGCGCNHLFKL